MLIVLPFYPGDADRMAQLLEWIIQLDPASAGKYTCLLSSERGTDAGKITALAGQYFATVRQFQYDPWSGDQTYPIPQNYAWQQTARYVADHSQEPWLWLEADAAPLKAGWIQTLADAHSTGCKPFSGHIVANQHMTGVGIYPGSVYPFCRHALFARAKPFDVVSGMLDGNLERTQRLNHLIQHVPEIDHHFNNREEVDAVISPEAVLFHRCKDGSLLEVLSGRPAFMEPVPVLAPTVPLWSGLPMIHVVERHKDSDSENNRRVSAAVRSWIEFYDTQQAVSGHLWDSERVSPDRKLPFLKDVLVMGLNTAWQDDQIIVLTNDDTILHPDIGGVIRSRLTQVDACCSFRANFSRGRIPKDASPEVIASTCDKDFGRDLFAFRKSWLRDHWKDIPDFYLGAPEWDVVLGILIRLSCGVVSTLDNLKEVCPPAELDRGYIIHEKHTPLWNLNFTKKGPETAHNLKLASEWYARHGLQALNTLK